MLTARQNFHFLIAGAGASGTTTLDKLINAIEANGFHNSNDFTIIICEKGDKFGPGFPYDPDQMGTTLLNSYANNCSLNNSQKSQFLDWLGKKNRFERLKEELKDVAPELYFEYKEIDPFAFYPRSWLGRFLEHRFQKSLKKAKKLNVNVILLPKHELVNWNDEERNLTVVYQNIQTGEKIQSEKLCHLFICTGVWEKKENKSFINSPRFVMSVYPVQKLKDSKYSGKNIGILGTGASAIDVVLEIMNANGRFIPSEDPFDWKYEPHNPENPTSITMLSRSGRIPCPRAKVSLSLSPELLQTIEKIVQKHGRFPLKECLRLIEEDLSETYKKPMSIEDLMGQEPTNVTNLIKSIDTTINGDLPGGIDGRQSVIWRKVFAIVRVKEDCNGEELKLYNNKDWPALGKIAGIPMVTSKRFLALMKMGLLDIKAIKSDWSIQDKQDYLEFNYTSRPLPNQEQIQESIKFDFMMDTTGLEISVHNSTCSLMKAALEKGQIREYIVDMGPSRPGEKYNAGGIDVNTKDFSIYDAKGVNHKNISYTGLGAEVKTEILGTFLLNSAAEKAVETIVQRIKGEVGKKADSA